MIKFKDFCNLIYLFKKKKQKPKHKRLENIDISVFK